MSPELSISKDAVLGKDTQPQDARYKASGSPNVDVGVALGELEPVFAAKIRPVGSLGLVRRV
jgi:hypothetical protein